MLSMPPLPRDGGAPAITPMARANFAHRLRLDHGAAPRGKGVVLDAIERDVAQHLVVLLDTVESERSGRLIETLPTSEPHGDGLSLSPAQETM
jgi:hypothetical protein